jgi:hypothetical protein
MYVIALVGLWMFWRERSAPAGAGRRLIAGLLAGFGVWNIIDVVLFHWILRIHHIRVDTDSYLVWDILWLVALGFIPLAAGWWMRGGPHDSSAVPRPGFSRVAVSLLVITAGTISFRPGPGPMTAVLFWPGMTPAQTLDAVAAVDGTFVSSDPTGTLVVMKEPADANPWRLYRLGAVMVGGTGGTGCLGWLKSV